MQLDKSNTAPDSETVEISLQPGVTLRVKNSEIKEHLVARANQLSALNHLLTSHDFESWDANIKTGAKWLAASLADEVGKLATVVTIGDYQE